MAEEQVVGPDRHDAAPVLGTTIVSTNPGHATRTVKTLAGRSCSIESTTDFEI